MPYQVWTIYSHKGLVIEYYVVNMALKRVQSAWAAYLDAKEACDRLNKLRGQKLNVGDLNVFLL